ncbi:MAG TPA: hypothetical protein VLE73_03160 [Candidatus Saccharimonadales bacterium]|nr:hypothetical protein [Candidatus Saccharimonadales bacterium]
MSVLTHYQRIEAPEIVTAGIVDLLRKPKNGPNRNGDIKWQGARFAVGAAFQHEQPCHQIIVDYPDDTSETGRFTHGMAISISGDGQPHAVATVSGSDPESTRPLSDTQKQIIGELIQRSINAGVV